MFAYYSGDMSHITSYIRQQQEVSIRDVTRTLSYLLDNTPSTYLASCPSQNYAEVQKADIRREKRGTVIVTDVGTDDVTAGLQSMALHAGYPIHPLPIGRYSTAYCIFAHDFLNIAPIRFIGRYPAYDGHPKFLVDWEIKKRDKALALQEEIFRREDVLHILQQKVLHCSGIIKYISSF